MGKPKRNPPFGLFGSPNIMTPNIEAYYNLGAGYWAELSTGRGIYQEPIWGVTIRPRSGPWGHGALFYSKQAAIAWITEITE